MECLALAYIGSGCLHKFSGLAGQLAVKQYKAPDRELPPRRTCACLGFSARKRAPSQSAVNHLLVESPSQMVHPLNCFTFRCIPIIDVRSADQFPCET